MRLYDTGGDGWQGATWRIYDATKTFVFRWGTLADGSSAREYYCLPDLCGWLAVGGGDADSEITYELGSAAGAPFYGVAPSTDFCASSCISARCQSEP